MPRRARRRGRRTWSQRLLLTFNVLLAFACLAAAGSFHLARTKAEQVPVYDIEAVARVRNDDTAVRNILLVGTDSSEGVDPDNPILKGRGGEHLADTIMILRVDPVAKNAAILSIPRDTWVPVAPTWGTTKINSALGRTNGQSQLIATIRHNFGISIDNYFEVNLQGFMSVFGVLGNLTVYNTIPVRDHKTGLNLTTLGCVALTPDQALAYARSRYLEWQDEDGDWHSDYSSDYGRITRQQDLLKQAANAAIRKGIHNPVTAYRLVNSAIGSFATDDTVNVDFVLNLIDTFREFPISELKTHRLPTRSVNQSWEEVLWDEALPLLTWFQGLRAPGAVEPGDVIVTLPESNDSTLELAAALDEVGFDAAPVADRGLAGSARVRRTTIRYGDGGAEAAQLLAAHLAVEPTDIEFVHEEDLPGRRVELIPGDDLTLRPEPLAISQVAAAAEFHTPTTTEPDLDDLPETAVTPGGVPTTVDGNATDGDGSATDPVVTSTTLPPDSGDATGDSPSSLSGRPSDDEKVGILPLDAAKAATCPG